MRKIWCFIRKYLGYPCKVVVAPYVPDLDVITSNDELELFNLINEYRKQNNLSELKLEALGCKLAAGHVAYMIEKKIASHDFFTDRSNKSHAKYMGEICAYGYVTPKSLFSAYVGSLKHKEIITNPIFTHIGISIMNRYNCCEFLQY